MREDIFHFVASRYGARLREAGYPVPADNDAILRAYHNVRLRTVATMARRVSKAANYAVPDHLVSGEIAFTSDVLAGNDLRPYQSTGLDRLDRRDAMLFDFGVQHFHTTIAQHPTNPKYKERTDPLLFAIVTDEEMYYLGFFDHGSWSKQTLLEIAHDNWPNLLKRFEIGSDGLRHSYTDGELAKLRKAGINTPTQRSDGTIHFSPGGGVTTSGSSIIGELRLLNLANVCGDIELQIRTDLGRTTAGGMPSDETLQVEEVSGTIYVRFGVHITRVGVDLLPPPL